VLDELKALSRETLVYGLSTVVGRLLNFFLLPLYTHTLIPAEYGIVATVFSYLAFLNVLYGYGMDFSFMRYYKTTEPYGEEVPLPESVGKRSSERPARDAAVFSTAFWSVVATTFAFSLVLFKGAGFISRTGQIPGLTLTLCSIAILASDALALVPFARLRMNHRAGLYAGLKVVNITVNIFLNYFFLVTLKLGIKGVFFASLAASLLTLILILPFSLSELSWTLSPKILSRLLRFGLPLVPAGLAAMMVQVIDRPILKFMTNDATVGLYQANYRLGIFMMMIVNMFDAAWRPFFLQRASHPNSKALFARILTYFSAGSSFVFLSITLFIAYAVTTPFFAGRALIQAAYWPGLSIVPVVTLGYLFDGVYINFLAPVTLAEKSEYVAYATGFGALINIVANLFWIPRWGMMGAAAATLAAYAGMAVFLYILGRRLYPVHYEWKRLFHVAAIVAAILVVARAMGISVVANHLALRFLLLMAFPLGLYLTGFFYEEERLALKRFALKIFRVVF
jgi:O-antigen/teichoic acid export membrane protein